ncbi:MAG: HEAT repeat domain-containing protein [Chloroflexota bacterium]
MKKQEIRTLTQLLEDDDNAVRHNAILALGKIEANQAVPTLIKTLHQEKDNRLRWVAISVLADIGQPAISPLVSALHDQDTVLRRRAGVALGKIGDPEALHPLIEVLQDEDATVRQASVVALSNMGSSAVLPLIFALQDEDEFVQMKASLALIGIGAAAVRPLIRLLPNERLDLQQAVIEILVKIGEPSVKPLISLLTLNNLALRQVAITILTRIGTLDSLIAAGKEMKGNGRQNYIWLEGFIHHLQPNTRQIVPLTHLATFFRTYTGPIMSVTGMHIYRFFIRHSHEWQDDFYETVVLFRRFFAFVHHHANKTGRLNPVSDIQRIVSDIKLLLIGFDEETQNLFENVLKRRGVSAIFSIPTQANVVSFCKEYRPDVIFAHDPDRLTLCQAIKGHPYTEDIGLFLFHSKGIADTPKTTSSDNDADAPPEPDGEIQYPFALTDLLACLPQIYRAALHKSFLD